MSTWTWFRVPVRLCDTLPTIGRAAVVYLVLARMADAKGQCYPSHKAIANAAGLSERSVRDYLAALEMAGLVERRRRRRETVLFVLPDLVKNGSPLPDKTTKNGKKRRQERQNLASKNGSPLPTKKNQEEEPVKERYCAVPAALSELMHGWNELGNGIVSAGNRVRVDRPSRAVRSAWNRRKGDCDLADATADVPALLAAIRKASFCHGQGWFTLPWLCGRNKNGELNAPRLLAGAFDKVGNGKPIGTGQRHPDDLSEQEGSF